MRRGWHVFGSKQVKTTPLSLDPHKAPVGAVPGGGGGATPTTHAELSQVPSDLQICPEPVDGGVQGCFPPIGTDVPLFAVQFAWALVGSATAANAVNANSIAKVREVTVAPMP